MSIAEEITRLSNAKAAIKQSIENKGVEVSDSALLDEYPALIDSIEVGSGGEGGGADSYYEIMWNMATNNGTDYQYLFYNYNSTTLDVSKFNTTNVTNMGYMFYNCNKLATLDLSNFDTSNVTAMRYMFYNCESLTSLDVSNFDTSNVTDMYSMFYNCESLTSLDTSNWDTSNVTTMYNMFYGCKSLTSLDTSNWDTSNVTTMYQTFYNCNSLTSLKLSNGQNNKISSMYATFRDCTSLTSLDLSGFDLSKCTSSTSFSNTFYNCTALVDFKAPKNISANMSFSTCTKLSHDSLMSIINNLATISGKTLTLGATNLAKLTDEEKAIATNKGWKIA